MKRMLLTTTIALSLMLVASLRNTADAQPRDGMSISYQTFYDELDPYGRWMDYPEYGYVWVPDAGPDFRPYSTNGHWVWSDDYEWMWVSDYDWGWAPFHYGRWMEDPSYGWMWVPGYEWSPAWVAWRDGGDYYGWAPLRPGLNISVNFSLGGYNPPIDYWVFAPRRYITSPRIYDYCVPRHNNITIINHTTIINNYNYNRNVFRTGPGRHDAERYTGRINPVRFRESSNPGRARFRNNEVSVYRPNVQRDNNRSFTPRNFERFDRNGGNNTIARRNENNLPQRSPGANNRFENRNTDRQTGETGIRERRRPVLDRNDAAANNNNNGVRERQRNVFDRNDADAQPSNPQRPNRQIERPNTQQGETRQFEPRNRQRANTYEANPNRQPAEPRTFERRNIERQAAQNNERMQQRRESNNEVRQQRQQTPRIEQPRQQQQQSPRFEQPRQQQQQQQQPSRQFERRSENNRSADNGNGNGRGGGGVGRRGK